MADDRSNRFKGMNPVRALNSSEVRIDLSQARQYDKNDSKKLGKSLSV
jgi:hypothetical protein